MRFRHGDAEAPLKVVGPAPEGKKGTRVTFLPSPDTFKITEFDFERLEHRYRELAFLNSGVRMILADARHEERVEHRAVLRGRHSRVRQISRPRQDAAVPRSDRDLGGRATASASTSRSNGMISITRMSSPSPTTSPSATAAPTWPRSARR